MSAKPTRRAEAPEIYPRSPYKTYGLMALVRGTTPAVDAQPERAVPTWPHLLMRGMICTLICLSALLAISLVFNAPLEELANPSETPNPAKAPWYFLGLQELVHYSAFVGGVLVPGLAVLGLALLPYLDRNPSRLPRRRRLGICLFGLFLLVNVGLMIVGTYFRGPGWSFTLPWAPPATGGHP